MRQYELVEAGFANYNPNVDEESAHRAYVYAMQAHGAQKGASAFPISDPLEVERIRPDLKLDTRPSSPPVLARIRSKTPARTRERIRPLFGPQIGKLVEG